MLVSVAGVSRFVLAAEALVSVSGVWIFLEAEEEREVLAGEPFLAAISFM